MKIPYAGYRGSPLIGSSSESRSLSLQRRTPRLAAPPQLSSAGYTAAALRPSVSVMASTPRNRVVGIRYTFVTASLLTSLPTGMPVHQSYMSSTITEDEDLMHQLTGGFCSQWGHRRVINPQDSRHGRRPPRSMYHRWS